ncbi:MAG: PorV/PorQ family protein [Saprospiraceae bacterium]|nr:PorV/PorQ family protein [Saprospiraceae bacterium]
MFAHRLVILLLGLLSGNFLFAQKYSNEFLSIGAGARAQGLGNAVVAGVSDIYSTFWNPAGLVGIEEETGLSLGAMHAEWFAGVGKYDFLGASIPLGNSQKRLALSAIRFGIDGIPNTLSLYESDGTINYDNVVEFSAADYAFLLTYSQPLKVKRGNLSIGGNVKVVRRIIGTFANSWGFGLDLGLQYHLKGLRLGLVGKDITSTFNAWTVNFTAEEKQVLIQTGNSLPDINSTEVTNPSLIFGVGYHFGFKTVGFTPEVNLITTTDGRRNVLIPGEKLSADLAFGLEVDYKEAVYLRAGVDQFQKETNFDGTETTISRPSLGIGLRLGAFRVDYAYTDLGDARNTYSHVISLVLNLKKDKDQ